jgi:cytochrome c
MTGNPLSGARAVLRCGWRLLALMGVFFLLAVPVGADSDDEYEGLPPGLGRDEVYGYCGTCHSVRLVTQQGLSREAWDETLVWMIEEQGMGELDDETHKLILDYLSEFLNTDHRPSHVKARP